MGGTSRLHSSIRELSSYLYSGVVLVLMCTVRRCRCCLCCSEGLPLRPACSSSSAFPFPFPSHPSSYVVFTLASHRDSAHCSPLLCFFARTAATLSGKTFSILPFSLQFPNVPNLNSRILTFVLLGRASLIAFHASFRVTPRSLQVVPLPLLACLPPSSKPIPVRLISRATWLHRSCAYQSFGSLALANRTMIYRLRHATSRATFALDVRAVLQASSRAQGMQSATT